MHNISILKLNQVVKSEASGSSHTTVQIIISTWYIYLLLLIKSTRKDMAKRSTPLSAKHSNTNSNGKSHFGYKNKKSSRRKKRENSPGGNEETISLHHTNCNAEKNSSATHFPIESDSGRERTDLFCGMNKEAPPPPAAPSTGAEAAAPILRKQSIAKRLLGWMVAKFSPTETAKETKSRKKAVANILLGRFSSHCKKSKKRKKLNLRSSFANKYNPVKIAPDLEEEKQQVVARHGDALRGNDYGARNSTASSPLKTATVEEKEHPGGLSFHSKSLKQRTFLSSPVTSFSELDSEPVQEGPVTMPKYSRITLHGHNRFRTVAELLQDKEIFDLMKEQAKAEEREHDQWVRRAKERRKKASKASWKKASMFVSVLATVGNRNAKKLQQMQEQQEQDAARRSYKISSPGFIADDDSDEDASLYEPVGHFLHD